MIKNNYNIEVVTAETVYPVTVSELKTHLGVSHSDHDTMLGDIIAAATTLAENYTWKTFGQRTLRMNMDSFADCIIPRSPIQSITNIKYYDRSNVQQTMSTSDYNADLAGIPARVHFYNTYDVYDRYNAVQITFVAGLADVTTANKGIKQAIKMICADMYDQRGSIIHNTSSISPLNYQNLLASYRDNYFF